MVYNSHVAQRMVSSCKNVNVPEIMQAVEQEQGASAGPSRSTRRWGTACVSNVHDKQFTCIFPSIRDFECGFNRQSLHKRGERWGTFRWVLRVFQRTDQRIWNPPHFVRANIRVFTLNACFIKHQKLYPLLNGFKRQPSLYSIDSNTNLVSALLIVFSRYQPSFFPCWHPSLEHSDFAMWQV